MSEAAECLAIAAAVTVYIAVCIGTGRVWNPRGLIVRKQEEPVSFWILMALCCLLVVGLIYAAIYMSITWPLVS
ncbi:hypothetical protein [Phenylobacterium sp.]|uniref:hypothetical protein n=1 Tax=Phenylobacterium sp. TaxID=1871053 RepID=UPI00286E519B|nr:hypothetical protein [Phenylobacterium sp.]